MDKHTALPWEVAQECVHAGQICTCHGDKGTWYEVWTPNWENGIDQEANAAFIVKACNNHYQLLDACRLALLAFESNSAIDWNILEQAIKQAEEDAL